MQIVQVHDHVHVHVGAEVLAKAGVGTNIRPRFGGCSSVVEHWIVAPVVAGSIPVIHPECDEAETLRR
jgi:hypothetical protein